MKKKVLIIDDEKDLCSLMKSYLSQRNFDVCDTYSLKEGLQQMKAQKPDILFLDNNLSDGTAWLHIEEFYAINPLLQLFLMSGFQPPLPETRRHEYKVITKPISFSDLDKILGKSVAAS